MSVIRILPYLVLMLIPLGSVAAGERTITCNPSGYVIEPRDAPPLYAGKECDAYHKQLGGGHWCWANDGLHVSFARGASSIDGLKLPLCEAINSARIVCDCATSPLPD